MFAALAEDDSDEGISAPVGEVAKEVACADGIQLLMQRVADLKSDMLIIDSGLSACRTGAATALIAMKTWAIAELARLEVQLAMIAMVR